MSAFHGGARADGTPDFATAARAPGTDPRAVRNRAESPRRRADSLAGDPAAYRAFLREKARDAGVDAFGGGGGGGGVSVSGPGRSSDARAGSASGRASRGDLGAPEGRAAASDARATVSAPAPTRRCGAAVAPADAAAASPLAALTSAAQTSPPPMNATVFDVEAHQDAVARAPEDPQYRARLVEAATRLAEAQDGAAAFARDPPGGRRCYARRGEAPARAGAGSGRAWRKCPRRS